MQLTAAPILRSALPSWRPWGVSQLGLIAPSPGSMRQSAIRAEPMDESRSKEPEAEAEDLHRRGKRLRSVLCGAGYALAGLVFLFDPPPHFSPYIRIPIAASLLTVCVLYLLAARKLSR